jgi:hypothetical protein
MISLIEVFYILNEEQIINDAYMGRKSPSTILTYLRGGAAPGVYRPEPGPGPLRK